MYLRIKDKCNFLNRKLLGKILSAVKNKEKLSFVIIAIKPRPYFFLGILNRPPVTSSQMPLKSKI